MKPTRQARSQDLTSDGDHSGAGDGACCGAAPARAPSASAPSVNSIAARNPFFIELARPRHCAFLHPNGTHNTALSLAGQWRAYLPGDTAIGHSYMAICG